MQPFSFVHAADLHLDSPFKGLASQSDAVARVLRDATFAAWRRIIDLCIDERVDFLLVAGDIYDGADRGISAQLQLRDGLERLQQVGIRSYVVHGNHDPLKGWASQISWPEGVHIFGGGGVEVVPHARDGALLCHVHGISYLEAAEQRNLARLYAGGRPAGSPFDIGLLHCNVGSNTAHAPYAPCELADLRDAGIDYWALGHVHERAIVAERPHVVYPGNPQGRSIRECGPRGCALVRVSAQGEVEARFVDTDVVRWEQAEVALDGLATLDALDAHLAEAMRAVRVRAGGRDAIVRLSLGGRGPLYVELRREGALDALTQRLRDRHGTERPFVWLEQLRDGSRPAIEPGSLAQRDDLVGEIVRRAQGAALAPAVLRSQVLGAVLGRSDLARLLEPIDDDELRALLDDACRYCIENLEVP